MSEATLYAFPTSLTAPVQQIRRCGRFPRNVLNLQRIRCERNDKLRLEENRLAKATETYRQQVLGAMMTTLADEAEKKGIVGLVICAIDADRTINGWTVGLCCADMDTAREVIRAFKHI